MDLSPRVTHFPDPRREAEERLRQHYDLGSSNGLTCLTCHVLVPHLGNHPKGHIEWHQAQDGSPQAATP